MKLTIGFSPCPNDTFIFDAIVNHKINCGDLQFEVFMEDVETLNQWALEGKLDITKLSYAVLPLVLDNYIVLNSGSALGNGVGPILISDLPNQKEGSTQGLFNIDEKTIAIPGAHTTANLLFSLAYPNAFNKVFMRYDEIENFVLSGKGPGVIIHENRFTYEARGLHKIMDLGEHWENKTGQPIPLGGIVINRSVDLSVCMQVDQLIKKSIDYAFRYHYKELAVYVKNNAREMSEAIMRRHIDLYVNNYSVSLGETGRKAVKQLLNIHQLNKNNNLYQSKEIFLIPDQP